MKGKTILILILVASILTTTAAVAVTTKWQDDLPFKITIEVNPYELLWYEDVDLTIPVDYVEIPSFYEDTPPGLQKSSETYYLALQGGATATPCTVVLNSIETSPDFEFKLFDDENRDEVYEEWIVGTGIFLYTDWKIPIYVKATSLNVLNEGQATININFSVNIA